RRTGGRGRARRRRRRVKEGSRNLGRIARQLGVFADQEVPRSPGRDDADETQGHDRSDSDYELLQRLLFLSVTPCLSASQNIRPRLKQARRTIKVLQRLTAAARRSPVLLSIVVSPRPG